MTGKQCYIIAEAGVNHNGSLELALQLVNAAAKAGADAVKFQTFVAKNLASAYAPKARYQKERTDNAESQLDMLQKLELDRDAHLALIDECRKRKIDFLSTPFDLPSLELLAGDFDLPRLKLSSGEITNAPFLLAAARTEKPVILSTGMSTLGEVEQALGVLAFGYATAPGSAPSAAAFLKSYRSDQGQRALRQNVVLLHCTTEYPAPVQEVNLRAMDTLQSAFGLQVGYSDHTRGITIPIAAAARGASLIEKHFTLDQNLPGPDHKASLEPDELTRMVTSVREVEAALGSGVKAPVPSELKNLAVARKSLVAARAIHEGERFSELNLAVKRPGTGASPFLYWEMLGRPAQRDYEADQEIAP